MQFLYDVMGSMIIGGIVLLMLLSFNASVMEGSAIQTFNTIVQSNMTSISDMVEYDFRKMGYRVGSVHDSAIVYADSVRILFRGDIDNSGDVESIAYFIGMNKAKGTPMPAPAPTVNPRAMLLFRQVDGTGATPINLGITRFKLAYYDENNILLNENPVLVPSRIRSIRLAIDIESTSPYDTIYTGSTWERTITPKNLN